MQLLFTRPWDFDVSDIKTPTWLWYGADDTLTPPSMGRYLQEHIPMLMETVPGWRRILRFKQLDGNGSSYLAIHEIESPGVFQTPEFKTATSTPWRDKVFGYVTRRERLTFQLIKGF